MANLECFIYLDQRFNLGPLQLATFRSNKVETNLTNFQGLLALKLKMM